MKLLFTILPLKIHKAYYIITINIKNTIWEGEKTRCFFNAIMEMIRITKRIILFM